MESILLHFLEFGQDILIFPHEASFEKVRGMRMSYFFFLFRAVICFMMVQVQQSSGRVYLLSFKHDDRKHFFWMQVNLHKQHLEYHVAFVV
jgi:hypothetical protein